MKRLMLGMAAAGLFLTVGGTAFEAVAGPRQYDLNILMQQPHPFAGPVAPTAWPLRLGPVPQAAPAPGPARPRPAAKDTSFFGSTGEGLWAAISEIRGGILAHDAVPTLTHKEPGADINLEVLFHSPGFLGVIGSPRPHLGFAVNTGGDTSQLYAGLTWEWDFWRDMFASLALGGAIHDGDLDVRSNDEKELGCRVLFRAAVELGYRFRQRHSLSLYIDQISNGGICDQNEGLVLLGIRYGYRL
ncbi:MAG: acyloxyacyl hydrolase [Alphaproteobacteria bacterium]|nr:acyloxyacyl hydrolase [Alphaproteobacteria bacterium]